MQAYVSIVPSLIMTTLSDIGFPLVYMRVHVQSLTYLLHFCVLVPEYHVVSLQFLIDRFYFSIGIKKKGDILEKTFIHLQFPSPDLQHYFEYSFISSFFPFSVCSFNFLLC